jgi:hypothetical protein
MSDKHPRRLHPHNGQQPRQTPRTSWPPSEVAEKMVMVMSRYPGKPCPEHIVRDHSYTPEQTAKSSVAQRPIRCCCCCCCTSRPRLSPRVGTLSFVPPRSRRRERVCVCGWKRGRNSCGPDVHGDWGSRMKGRPHWKIRDWYCLVELRGVYRSRKAKSSTI